MGDIEIKENFDKEEQIKCIQKILDNVKNDLWNVKSISFELQYESLYVSMDVELNREKIIKS